MGNTFKWISKITKKLYPDKSSYRDINMKRKELKANQGQMISDKRYNSSPKQTKLHSVFINNAASQFKKTLKMLYANPPISTVNGTRTPIIRCAKLLNVFLSVITIYQNQS